MTFDLLSSYTNEFIKWGRSFASAETHLKDNPYVRLRRGNTIDPEFFKLFKNQNFIENAAKNGVRDAIVVKQVIPASLPGASDVAQTVNKIIFNPSTPTNTPSFLLIEPTFPTPGVQPHPIPSPTIHVNPHFQGSLPVPDLASDFVSIAGGPPPFDPDLHGGGGPFDPLQLGNPPRAGDRTEGGIPLKLLPLLELISKLAGRILPLIPPLLYAFYYSEEKTLQNANVNILATRTPKKYTVALGNKDGEEMSIDFEVVAGKFYRDEIIEANYGFAHSIFKTNTLLSYLPAIGLFEWKRKIHETDCNITIDDPGNLSLQKGPISVYYPLSKNEGFNIIYRDPTATSAIATSLFNGRTHDYHLNAEDSEYSSFNTASMKVVEPLGRYEKERTQTASLPFDDDPKKADHYYLKVTQYNAAVE